MAGKKGAGENSKKAQGQARKADAAAAKNAAKERATEEAEAKEWNKGAKSNAKAYVFLFLSLPHHHLYSSRAIRFLDYIQIFAIRKPFNANGFNSESAAAKAAEAARKKAEKDALLAAEEAALPSKPKGNAKTAQKKSAAPSRGIDAAFASLDSPSALSASGIDNALDALSLATNTQEKVERHPERRFKAAYAKYEERRLEEMKDDKSLRKQQKINKIYEEFKKHPDNPFNQVAVRYDASKEEIKEVKEKEREKKEKRLAQPGA